jgi:hypothetical protein
VDDWSTRSVNGLKQIAQELENDISRILIETKTTDSLERLRMLMNELRRAMWKMEDLQRQLHELRSPAPLVFKL